MSDDSTVVITNIHEALNTSEQEASEKPACIIIVGGEHNGTIYDLILGLTTVGRSHENTIAADFRGVSRKHFQIDLKEDAAYLSDMGSSNGTYLNNKKVEKPTIMNRGDIIKIGNIAFKYIPKGDPERLTYDKLQFEANTDGLTGCYNKTFFNNAFSTLFRKSQSIGSKLSLIFFDLDHFKHLNDTYGHDAGDYVLKEMAKIIKDNGVRDGDIFARYGGEEFAVVLPDTGAKQALEIAERLRALIENHSFIYDSKRLPVTASIGVADYQEGILTSTDMFKRADIAVYTSKNGGRNLVSFFK